jgi:HEAT repeats
MTAAPFDRHDRPAVLVAEACREYGTEVIARWCADLLTGRVAYDDPGRPPLVWLAGRAAAAELRRGDLVERGVDYWPRVWAARGLRYAWVPDATPAVVRALADPAWRVREMAAKVVRQRDLGEAADALSALATDPMPRVRAAALRAAGTVGEVEHADALRAAANDPEPAVRRAAEAALDELRRRLDRDV